MCNGIAFDLYTVIIEGSDMNGNLGKRCLSSVYVYLNSIPCYFFYLIIINAPMITIPSNKFPMRIFSFSAC